MAESGSDLSGPVACDQIECCSNLPLCIDHKAQKIHGNDYLLYKWCTKVSLMIHNHVHMPIKIHITHHTQANAPKVPHTPAQQHARYQPKVVVCAEGPSIRI